MTNKWYVETPTMTDVVVMREQDDLPVLSMAVSVEEGDGLWTQEQAIDVAQQIVDDWNFSCDELEKDDDLARGRAERLRRQQCGME